MCLAVAKDYDPYRCPDGRIAHALDQRTRVSHVSAIGVIDIASGTTSLLERSGDQWFVGRTSWSRDGSMLAIEVHSPAIGRPAIAVVPSDASSLDDAVILFTKSSAVAPRFPWAYVGRAAAYVELGRHDEALADCDKALALDPTIIQALMTRGSASKQVGRLDQTRKDWARARELLTEGDPRVATLDRWLKELPER